MRVLCVAVSVLALSAGVAAQGPAAKVKKATSTIAVTLGGLGCTSPLGADAFSALAWSWGATNPVDLSGGGGGGGAGKVSVADLSLMKGFDACSPALLGAVATGKHFPSLTMTQSNSDGTVTTLTLSDVLVSSWQASGNVESEAASESVSLAFGKVCLADGASGAKFCYDIKANKIF